MSGSSLPAASWGSLHFPSDHRDATFHADDFGEYSQRLYPLLSKDGTEPTERLHKAFGFRTDYEFITKSYMRAIIKETKQLKQEAKKK